MKGMTLVELMIAVAIGAGLMASAVALYVRGRAAYQANASIARLQEQARFAFAVIEPDVEMAGHFGFTSDASTLSLAVDDVPAALKACGADFVTPVNASNGAWPLACAAYQSGPVAGADTLTVRRVDTREARAEANRLQVYASRFTALTSQPVFFDGAAPGVTDDNHRVHNLLVRTYYIARDSVGRRGFPALRVKSLTRGGFDEDEVMSGVEDLQVQLLGASPVAAVRVWLRVRSDEPDASFVDDRTYRYADVEFTPSGAEKRHRRAVIARTIAVRNARRE
jgi:prepilin-type N-terminal cleavage/methylation domain-containing protein